MLATRVVDVAVRVDGRDERTWEAPAAMVENSEKREHPEHAVAVLIVDDDVPIRQTLRWVLEETTYPVLEAPDGSAALEILRDDPRPLVVLLDLLMPRMDGLGVLRAIAAHPSLAARRAVVLLSAQGRPLPPELEALLFAIVPKPFDLTDLLDTIHAAAASLPTE